MSHFAVIDTETNWVDRVMSIGTVIADADTFEIVSAKYHILPAECAIGGMYEDALYVESPVPAVSCTREEALEDLMAWFAEYAVTSVFAYNASFDRNHLRELGGYDWYDIMRLAAYRQYNPRIPACADCYSTGRMKRGYGVEPMLRLLSGQKAYSETHNALHDALDELEIMRLLGYKISDYIPL